MSKAEMTGRPPALVRQEYLARVGRTQEAMAEERLGALLITSADNFNPDSPDRS